MTAEEWAELVWTEGRGALLRHLSAESWVLSAEYHHPARSTQHSALAARAAEMLVEARGGDALERAEFARLFAIGEPQKGLRAFLARRKGMSVAEKT